MNRSVIESSPVQQMMAGNPNWWSSINSMRPPQTTVQSAPFLPPPSNLFPQFTPTSSYSSFLVPSLHENQEFPESWSQLLLGRVAGEEENKVHHNMGNFETRDNKMENWEEQVLHHHRHHQASSASPAVNVKQETHSNNSYMYGHANEDHHHLQSSPKPTWSSVIMPASSPISSCVTSFSSSNNNNNSMLDFSTTNNNSKAADGRHPPPDRSSECDSTATGGASKKARVQPSSTQSTFKVRKEKLGDRITALHQLVSPFGKTDTASVLLEAIGYIRFLQSQIEALSLPYLTTGSSGNIRQPQQSSVLQGERNCIFPEDPGQLLNDNCMKRKAASDQQESNEAPKKDLRSRGLCLVPVSCTLQVGSDNGADYWAPALGGGGFR